ncbi:MAG: response regulator [Desulfobacteraceae bacterium]
MENYIADLKTNLKNNHIRRAKSLLNGFSRQPEATKRQVLHELALVSDAVAMNLLGHLAGENLRNDVVFPRFVQLIRDRSHVNFGFAAILYKVCGKKEMETAAPLMKHILINETDPGILAETITAAGTNRLDSLAKEIAEYLYFGNRELKAHAVRALEKINSPTSLKMLEDAADTVKCDRNILDALAVLRSTAALDAGTGESRKTGEEQAQGTAPIENGRAVSSLLKQLASKQIEKRFKAFCSLGEMDSSVVPRVVEALESKEHDLPVNGLGILARIRSNLAAEETAAFLNREKRSPGVTFAAYEALNSFGTIPSAASLIWGVDSPLIHVCMSAVGLLDRHFTDFVFAELQSRIESGSKTRHLLVQAIIDAKCTNIIEAFLGSDSFSYVASNHLAKRATPGALTPFIRIAGKRGLFAREKKYREMLADRKTPNRPVSIVVSCLPTVRNLYETILFSAGYLPRTFSSSQDAFEAMAGSAPRLVLCDLFLDGITGVDLAGEIRTLYRQNELPVVVSTRQKDFTGPEMKALCQESGINGIIEFPGTIRQIELVVNE